MDLSALRAEYADRVSKAQVDALVAWAAPPRPNGVERADLAEGARVVRLSTAGLDGKLRDAGLDLADTPEGHTAMIRFAFMALIGADIFPVQAKPQVRQLLDNLSTSTPATPDPGAAYAAGITKAEVDDLVAWLVLADPANRAHNLAEGARLVRPRLVEGGVKVDDTPDGHRAAIRFAFAALLDTDVLPTQARSLANSLIAGLYPGQQQPTAPPVTPQAKPTPPPMPPPPPPPPPPRGPGSLFEQRQPRSRPQMPWWLRLGSQQPVVTEACQVAGCQEVFSSVDIYCADSGHDDLLLFQNWEKARPRWWTVTTVRSAGAGLVWLGASSGEIWPVYGLAAAIGCLCIGFLLHAHRVSRLIAIIGLAAITAAVASLTMSDLDANTRRIAGTLAVGVPLVGGALLCLATMRHRTSGMVRGIVREAMCAIVTTSVAALIALAAWWATTGRYSDWFIEVPDITSTRLLLWGLGAAASTLLLAALGALLVSRGAIDPRVPPLFKRLPQARPVDWTYKRSRPPTPARRTTVDRLAWRVAVNGHKVITTCVDIARRTVNRVLTIEAAVRRRICICLNWVHRRLVRIARRVKFVVTAGGRILATALGTGSGAAAYSARPVGAYVAAFGAAVAALHLAASYTDYLLDGALRSLAAGVGWSILGLVLCGVIVERLASVPRGAVSRSARRFAITAGPDFGIVVVLSGLLLGIPGSHGYGPIHIGWITKAGLVVIVTVVLYAWARDRTSKPAAQP